MKTTVRIDGLNDLAHALKELPKATGRNVCRRVLAKALRPMEATAEALAPNLTGELRESIEVSTKLSKRQASEHRASIGAETIKTAEGWRSTPQTTVFMFMGPRAGSKTIVQEFGSVYVSPQPYMRPAWDSGAGPALETIKADMWDEINKAAARLAKKRAA